MKTLYLLVSGCLLLSGCGQSGNPDSSVNFDIMEDAAVAPITRQSLNMPVTPPMSQPEEPVNKKKIIKDGRLEIETQSIVSVKTRIDSLIRKYDGYYASEDLNNWDNGTALTLNIRIPSENFEALIAGIEQGEGELVQKRIHARDVTDQFIDLETRLKNKRSYLERYRDLLKKAQSIKEILEVEEHIRTLEEEIESTEGKLKYLADQVAYSSLEIFLTQDQPFSYIPKKRPPFAERIKQAVSGGWTGLIDFLLFLISVWPIWIVLAGLSILWKRYIIARKKKK